MKLYTNDPLVSSKQRIGLWSTLLGVAMMVGAIFVAQTQTTQQVMLAWLISLGGLGAAMFGTYHINRWARRPVAHQSIAQSLEKLDSRHLLLNYVGAVPHLLLTPKGLVGIRVKRYEGPAHYDAATQTWKGKFSFARLYMQGMTAEGLGNPTGEAGEAEERIKAWLVANGLDEVPVAVVLYFLSSNVPFTGDPAPVTIAQPDTLKKSVQEQFAELPLLSHDTYNQTRALLEESAESKGLLSSTPEKRARVKSRSRRKA